MFLFQSTLSLKQKLIDLLTDLLIDLLVDHYLMYVMTTF